MKKKKMGTHHFILTKKYKNMDNPLSNPNRKLVDLSKLTQ